MTKLSVIVLAMLLTFSSVASAVSTAPIWKQIARGETVQQFAQRCGLTVAELYRLNAANLAPRNYRIKPGEPLNVNPATDSLSLTLRAWKFPGGDPRGPSLIPAHQAGDDTLVMNAIRRVAPAQIDSFLSVPEDVRERMKSQLEWTLPSFGTVRSTLDSPKVAMYLVFGGDRIDSLPNGRHVRSKVKSWSNVMFVWVDPVTKQPIEELEAAVYDWVDSPADNSRYQLAVFLGCQNGTVFREELPPAPMAAAPAPPEVTVVEPPPPPVTVVEPPPPPPAPVTPTPAPEVRSRDYNQYYVAWLTNEAVSVDNHGDLFRDHIFIGQEFGLWNKTARYGVRIRNAEAMFEVNKAQARAGDHNAGLVLVPFSNKLLRLDVEGGLGYSAIQRLYTQVDHPDESTWMWEQRKLTTDGFGPYVRTQWLLPGSIYADLKWRNHRVIENLGGYVTIRPGWFYAKAAYDLQLRPAVARHVHGLTIPFAADTMTMNEARLGISPSPRIVVYGSYQHWRYASGRDNNLASFWFTRFGPGGGMEWYLFRTNAWRLDANVIRFKIFDHARYRYGPGWTDIHAVNREWRLKIGLVYQPQPK